MSEEVDNRLLMYRFLCILRKYSIKEEVWAVGDDEWIAIMAAINQYSERDRLYE